MGFDQYHEPADELPGLEFLGGPQRDQTQRDRSRRIRQMVRVGGGQSPDDAGGVMRNP